MLCYGRIFYIRKRFIDNTNKYAKKVPFLEKRVQRKIDHRPQIGILEY